MKTAVFYLVASVLTDVSLPATGQNSIDEYTYFGEPGGCRGGSDDLWYDYNRFNSAATSLESCASACLANKGQQSPYHVGFQIIFTTSCLCLYEGGRVPHPYDNTYGTTTSGIKSVKPGPNPIYCYVYNDHGVTPSPPTQSPEAAPSAAPSRSKFGLYQGLTIGIASGTNGSTESLPSVPCTATMEAGVNKVDCTFALVDLDGANAITPVYASLYTRLFTAGDCGSSGSFATTPATSDYKTEESIVQVTDAEKNCLNIIDGINYRDLDGNCVVVKYACARADLIDTDENLSVEATTQNIEIKYIYSPSGQFSAEVSTASFDAEAAEASASREVGIEVWTGACESNPSCLITDGDSNCFTEGLDKLSIGQTLTLCVKSSDSDVLVSELVDVKATSGSYESQLITVEGQNNFVTNAVGSEGGVTLSTLMVPAYYDSNTLAGTSSISITGTAKLVYGRRHMTEDRVLQSKSANDDADEAFLVNIPLAQNDIPEVATKTLQETSASTGAIDEGAASGVAAVVLWLSLLFV